jgi:hypothetical protein
VLPKIPPVVGIIVLNLEHSLLTAALETLRLEFKS